MNEYLAQLVSFLVYLMTLLVVAMVHYLLVVEEKWVVEEELEMLYFAGMVQCPHTGLLELHKIEQSSYAFEKT